MQFLIALFALIIGLAFCFGGWRFFMILLPLWGLFVGFNVGTDVVSAIFGDGTFATVTSWVVGFVAALIFAVFSYLWYYFAIALLGAGLGYAIGSGAWGLIGNEQGFIAIVLGLVVGAVFAVGILALNVPRLLVIVVIGLAGAVTMLAGWFVLIGKMPTDQIHWTYVGKLITDSWFYLVIFGVVAAAGILAQMKAPAVGPDSFELEKDSYRY